MARVDVKVCLLGSSGVGKTCMLDRYINDQFEPSPKNTIGAAFAAKKVRVQDGKTITLGVWDTAGAEQFESLSRMYYHGSRAAVVCFDACQRASFDKLQFWVNELRTNEPHCRIYIVATKADLLEGSGRGGSRKPAVSADAAQKFAAGADATVTYTSAKTGRGITELFQGIAEALAASLGDGGTPRPPGLPAIAAHPPLASPRSHSIVLSPGSSPPPRGSRPTAMPSTCC